MTDLTFHVSPPGKVIHVAATLEPDHPICASRSKRGSGLVYKWLIEDLAVDRSYRGKGYGSQLLEKTCEVLWSIERLPIGIFVDLPGFKDDSDPEAFIKTPGIVTDCYRELNQWYARHGFQRGLGDDRDPCPIMFRSPSLQEGVER